MDASGIVEAFAASPTFAAIGIAFMMLFFGIKLLSGIDKESPLAGYVFQILGLVMVGPLILTLALTVGISNEALTGFVGAIVGYFFGAKSTGKD